jgi:CheY-like chemotaxis protein
MDQGRPFRSVKILIVDDSPGDIRLIREALRDAQMIVHLTVARDGAEALEYLNRNKADSNAVPDFIVLDLNLPKRTGREVLNEIKSDPDLKKIPVLVMSSSGAQDDIEAAYHLNANCYIRKPADLPGYEKVVRAIEDFWCMTVTLPENYPARGTSEGDYVAGVHRLQ